MMKVTKISREERLKRVNAGKPNATFVSHKNMTTSDWNSYQLPTDEINEQHQVITILVDLSEVAEQDKYTIARQLVNRIIITVVKDEKGNEWRY